MLKTTYLTLLGLNVLTEVVICIFVWIRRKKDQLNLIRLFITWDIVDLIIQLCLPHNDLGHLLHNVLFNLSFLIKLSIFYLYFNQRFLLPGFKKAHRILYSVFIVVTAFFFSSQSFGVTHFLPTYYGVTNLFITIPCILYFYELFRSDEEMHIANNPHFYIASAVLFYEGTTFPFFIGYQKLYATTPEIIEILVSVQCVINLIYFFVILKAFLCRQPEEK